MSREDKTSKPHTIRKDSCDGWAAYATKTYGARSVLAGQRQEVPVGFYDSLSEAKAAHPQLAVDNNPAGGLPMPTVSETPASWFDPADAGEHWHEDDY